MKKNEVQKKTTFTSILVFGAQLDCIFPKTKLLPYTLPLKLEANPQHGF